MKKSRFQSLPTTVNGKACVEGQSWRRLVLLCNGKMFLLCTIIPKPEKRNPQVKPTSWPMAITCFSFSELNTHEMRRGMNVGKGTNTKNESVRICQVSAGKRLDSKIPVSELTTQVPSWDPPISRPAYQSFQGSLFSKRWKRLVLHATILNRIVGICWNQTPGGQESG